MGDLSLDDYEADEEERPRDGPSGALKKRKRQSATPLYPRPEARRRGSRGGKGKRAPAEAGAPVASAPVPHDLLVLILQWLTAGELRAVGSRVCRQWRRAIFGPGVLQKITAHHGIITVGGTAKGFPLATVEHYCPFTNRTTLLPPLQAARHYCGLAISERNVYVCGGIGGNRRTLASCEAYDPVTQQWTETSPMLRPRASFSLCSASRFLFAFGGASEGRDLASNEMFDPVGQAWTPLAPLAHPRRGQGCTVYDGVVYLLGGACRGTTLNEAVGYDVERNAFLKVPNMHERRWACAAASLDGMVYALGGSSSSSTSVECYDPRCGFWIVAPELPAAMSHHLGLAYDDTIYLVGTAGDTCDGRSSPICQFYPSNHPQYNDVVIARDRHVTVVDVESHVPGGAWASCSGLSRVRDNFAVGLFE
ncbi:Kelch-like protein diablo [Diplonema papillatum]|nr:Kelch-like protein diablo [Diplonema papillatum]